MLSEYSFLLLALCLAFTASIRPFVTLFTVCSIAHYQAILGFVLPDYLSFLNHEIALIALAILALTEIISDKMYSPLAIAMHSIRPLAAILPPLTVMRFSNALENVLAAAALSLAIGLPFMRLFTSIIVPKHVGRADKNLRGAKHIDTDKYARISNSLPLSLLQDIICAGLAYSAFHSANLVIILLFAAIFALVIYQQHLRTKAANSAPPRVVKRSSSVQLPKFPSHALSTEQSAQISPSKPESTQQDDTINEDNGYGYIQ